MKALKLAIVITALLPALSSGEPDSFGLGNGHSGTPANITVANTVVNSYSQLTGPAAPGDNSLNVSTVVGFAIGDLVLVLQTTGIVPTPPSGGPSPLDISTNPVGRWEFARLSSAAGSTLGLTAPLVNSYAASVTQVIKVPEYINLTIAATGSITAQPWNGATGGVVALLATGTLTNNGTISAAALGFRPGVPTKANGEDFGCSLLDTPSPSVTPFDYALKGEGIASTRFGGLNGGRGNVANGAGGGDCNGSGGGGGGNGGQGGAGGKDTTGTVVGGIGGAALTYSLLDHMTFGGGGGAGQQDDNAPPPAALGAGGGVVFIRAGALAGTGFVRADGQAGASSPLDGSSGGGAGGSMYLRFAGAVACGGITANGGNGGNAPNGGVVSGPGGGGGGGQALIQGSSIAAACNPAVISGQGGTTAGGTNYGAGPTVPVNNGVVNTLPGGFTVPAVPTLVTPANGLITNNPKPVFSGTAQPNTAVIVYVDGIAIGQTTSNGAGGWTFTPVSNLSDGAHQAQAAAQVLGVQSAKTSANAFTVDTHIPAAPVINVPANNSLTNNNKPPVTGAAEATDTVNVYVDGVLVCSGVANGVGAWSCIPAVAIADGPHVATAIATDPAGTSSATSNPVNFTIDTHVPPKPTITAPLNNAITNNNKPIFTGTAEANDVVKLYVDGTLVCSTVANGAGAWTCTPTTSLADGPHVATATGTDAAGTPSPPSSPINFAIDTHTPGAPVITAPANGSITNSNKPTFTGTAEPNDTINVYVDGLLLCTSVSNGAGAWSCAPATAIADGSHVARATATDAAGTTSALSAPVSFQIDTHVPPDPLITSPVNGTITNNNQLSIVGTAEANDTIKVYVDGALVCTALSSATGAWTCMPATPIPDGPHAAIATSTDAAGTTGPASAAVNFTIDTHVPPKPVLTMPANNAVTNNNKPTLGGTAEPNDAINVYVDGVLVCSTTSNASGVWSCSPSAALPDGNHVATATGTDAAGTTSPSSNPVNFAVDTHVPAKPLITSPANNSITNSNKPPMAGSSEPNDTVDVYVDGTLVCVATANGAGAWSCIPSLAIGDGPHVATATATDPAGTVSPSSVPVSFTIDTHIPQAPAITAPANGSITNINKPPFTGTAERNDGVNVYVDGTLVCSAIADSTGAWACTPTTVIADGVHVARATGTDPAGTTSPPSTAVTFTIDTHVPAQPIILLPVNNSVTNNTRPPIAGTAEAGSTVNVYLDAVLECTVLADSTGAWTCNPTLPLSDGPHLATATATDAAGTTGPSSTADNFTVDTHTPAAPVITAPANNSISNNPAPSIVGTSEPAAAVAVYVDGVLVCSTTASATGDWSCAPSAPLADGTHVATATATDPAGTSSATSTQVRFTIDTHVPTAPVITAPVNNSTTNDSRPPLAGTAEANSSVTVSVDGVVVCTVNASAAGAWDCVPATDLADGSHTATATSSDAAGSTSLTSSPVAFVIDTHVPGAPVINTPANNSVSTDQKPVLGGTAEPNSTVKVTVDGNPVCTVAASTTGIWSCPPTAPLAFGAHVAVAVSSDGAGTLSPPSPTDHFKVENSSDGGTDAGTPDAGPAVETQALRFTGGGCGCGSASNSGMTSGLLMALLLPLLRFRRKKNSERA